MTLFPHLAQNVLSCSTEHSVQAAEAIITSIIAKVSGERARAWKLHWLNRMLWGGVLLLAIEHIWHGEVVPWPPFLTAMQNPADFAVMLHEMKTIGGAMSIVITLFWALLVALSSRVLHPEVRAQAD